MLFFGLLLRSLRGLHRGPRVQFARESHGRFLQLSSSTPLSYEPDRRDQDRDHRRNARDQEIARLEIGCALGQQDERDPGARGEERAEELQGLPSRLELLDRAETAGPAFGKEPRRPWDVI